MTLDELLEELAALPFSARSATVFVRKDDYDDVHILSVSYEDGVVILALDQEEPDDID